MRLPHCIPFLLAALAAPASSQIQATYVPYGAGCAGTGGGIGASNVVPAAFASAFAPSNNVMPFSTSPSRYQQVFLGSELPAAFTMTALGVRWDNQTSTSFYGAQVDLEIQVGYTTRTPTTLSTTFDANFDAGAPVTVLARSLVRYPDAPNPPPTDPTQFQLVIPWTGTFAWTPMAGRNLLVQIYQRGNSTGFPSFGYPLDAGWSPSTARLYGADTATTGSLDGFAYGLVMNFLAFTNTAVPTLSSAAQPQIGNTFRVSLGQARPSTAALLLLGASRSAWGALPLPLDLGVVGAPGCHLLASGEFISVIATNAQGRGSFTYSLPMNLGLIGVQFFNQFLVLDPTVNGLGYVVSNGGAGLIGT